MEGPLEISSAMCPVYELLTRPLGRLYRLLSLSIPSFCSQAAIMSVNKPGPQVAKTYLLKCPSQEGSSPKYKLLRLAPTASYLTTGIYALIAKYLTRTGTKPVD